MKWKDHFHDGRQVRNGNFKIQVRLFILNKRLTSSARKKAAILIKFDAISSHASRWILNGRTIMFGLREQLNDYIYVCDICIYLGSLLLYL